MGEAAHRGVQEGCRRHKEADDVRRIEKAVGDTRMARFV